MLSILKLKDKSACSTIGFPRLPTSATCLISELMGKNLVHMASMMKTLFSFAAWRRERNSAALQVAGFSTKTCL